MGTPEFIVELRKHIGHDLLWLNGATAVVVRHPERSAAAGGSVPEGVAPRYAAAEVLLVRRSDNGAWTPITGIVDPGEHPAATAAREAREEAGVEIRVVRLAQVGVTKEVTFANGDRTQFIDHTFECEWVGGEARVSDEENTEVRWVPVAALDAEGGIPAHMRRRIAAALSGESAARF